MPLVMALGKVWSLEKRTGKNESNEPTFAAAVNILAKRIKKKYVNFGPNTNRAEINEVIYTQANVAIGDRVNGHLVVEDFGNGKYGIK